MTHESEKPRRSLFDEMIRHSTGENDVWIHKGVLNGQPFTIINYSSNPFAKTGVEIKAEVCVGRREVTRDMIENMHTIAEKVRAAYGEAAVGALPELPAIKTQEAA